MNPGAIVIGFAILLISVPYVVSPFLNQRQKEPGKTTSRKNEGEGPQKDALAAIRDLDFDFQTGKVTQDDYEALRPQLVLEAAGYLQTKQQEDEKLEAMIRARLQVVKQSVMCEKCGGVIRPKDRFCPICGAAAKDQAEAGQPATLPTCPNCEKNVKEGDLFCTGCGTRVNRQATIKNTTAEN